MRAAWVNLAAVLLTLQFCAMASPGAVRAQGPIASGQTLTGAIFPVADSDTWTFSANSGNRIVVRVGQITESGNFAPQIRLYGPGMVPMGTSSGAVAGEIVAAATSSGTFTVIVNDVANAATGTYRVTLAQTGVGVVVSAGDEGGPLTNGAMQTGTIGVGDLDVWTVTAGAGDAIVVRMGDTESGSTMTPSVRIYDPSGAPVGGIAGGSAGPTAEEVSATAVSPGPYLVVVGDGSSGLGGVGDYRLTLAKTGAAVVVSGGDEGGPLTNGAMQTGTIGVGDLDVWTVTANPGETIVVRMGDTKSGSTLRPWVRFYSPAGAPVGGIAGGSSGLTAEEASATVAAGGGGTYLVVVGDGNTGLGGVGDYRLTLAKGGAAVVVSAGDEGGPLTNGAMQTGTISVGDLDVWTVTANPTEVIVVRMGDTKSGSTLAPWVRIYNPAGAQVGGIAGGSSGPTAEEASATVLTGAGGTYLVVVGDGTSGLGGVGDYRLTLAKAGAAVVVSAGDQGGPLTNGAMQTGTISVGDLDVWTVTANVGETIVARMGETVSGSTLTPWVRIYNPAGTQVGGIAGGSAGPAAEEAVATVGAGAGGTYLVVVGDGSSGLGGVGDYRLTLAKAGAVVVSAGDEGGPLGGLISATIDVGDLDVWTLSAIGGQTIHVTMEEAIVGSSLTPYVRLYTPAGALLASGFGAALAQVSVIAPSTATYLVVVGDATSGLGGSGPYWLAPAATTGVSGTLQSAQLSLSPAFPSPFATRTVFHFAVAQAGEASLRVYDAQGRLVRTLVNEPDEAVGRYEAVWDGRNDAGVELDAGIYLARLDSGGRRQIEKVILTR